MSPKQIHLLLYNSIQAIGWAICLLHLCQGFVQGLDYKQLYITSGTNARVFQAASVLEVVHAAIGLVPSNPFNAFLQWFGRCHVLFAILHLTPQVQSTVYGPVMLLCWSLSEVIRYPWYALNVVDKCPYWLTWLRYSAFIVLYPIGVVCEMALMYLALPTLKKERRWSISMPNKLNFAFEYHTFIKVLLLLYPFLWWQLYATLLRQRRNKLSPAVARDRTKAVASSKSD